jgi:hypothetical protein
MTNLILEELCNAAAENDLEAAHTGMLDLFAALGVRLEDVSHMAEQRCMRAALMLTGRTDMLKELNDAGGWQRVDLPEDVQQLMVILQGSFFDGAGMMLRAVKTRDELLQRDPGANRQIAAEEARETIREREAQLREGHGG